MAPTLPTLYCSLMEGRQTAAAEIREMKGGQVVDKEERVQVGKMQPEQFRINQINDFTTEVVRGEKAALEESGALPVLGICPSR